jgi:hypothetical protein
MAPLKGDIAEGTNNCHGGIERVVVVAVNKGHNKILCRVASQSPF